MKEIWKDIPEYEGLYQVSNFGNVKKNDGKILKPSSKHSSLFINLRKNKIQKGFKIHKLVMLTFVGVRPKNMQICHNDGNFKNNRLDNLRYDTAKENKKDCYRYSDVPKGYKLSVKDVVKIRKLYKEGKYTQKEIGEMFGVSRSQINHVITKRSFYWVNDEGNII